MKNLYFIIGILLLSVNGFSQTTEPDQNPNYKASQQKYAQISDSLNQTQGQTVQNTYAAFDWTEYKTQKKQNRKDVRNNRRQMKYQFYRPYGYNNGGYNSYYNNGYYNNSPYYGYSYYKPYGYSNGLYNSLLLGATLYSIFH
jgi:hypothetical protein